MFPQSHGLVVPGMLARTLLLGTLLLASTSAAVIDSSSHEPATPAARAQEEEDLTFEGSGTHLNAAVIDAAAGYAYYGTSTCRIARVRLSDLSRDGTLVLNPGECPSTAAIDSAAGFAYFGVISPGAPGAILKVRLADFTLAAALPLAPADGGAISAALDSAGGYAYFGTDSQPGTVVRVRLDDFTLAGTLTLEPGEDVLAAAVLDAGGGHVYFGTDTQPGRVVQVRLADFTRSGAVTLPEGNDHLRVAVLDGTAAYFGTYTQPGRIVKVRLADLSYVTGLVLDTTGESYVQGALIDAAGQFAYFGIGTICGMAWTCAGEAAVVKVRLSDFTWTDTLGTQLSPGFLGSAVLDPIAGLAYFGASWASCYWPNLQCGWNPAMVVRVSLADFSVTGMRSPGEDQVTSVLFDGAGYGYFGLTSGQIVRAQLSDFSRDATLNLPYEDDVLLSGVFDAASGHAYFGTDTAPGKIIKVHLADLTVSGVLTLNQWEDSVRVALVDHAASYAYFATGTGAVIRVNLGDFSRDAALTLGAAITCGVLDPAGGFAYFGLDDGTVAQVRLADFQFTGLLPLGAGTITAAVVDAANGYAYFATNNGWNEMWITRLRLADFTLGGSLFWSYDSSFHIGRASAGALDSLTGLSYWGVGGCYLYLPHFPCDPASFLQTVRLGDLALLSQEGWALLEPNAAAVDAVGRYLYVGTATLPGQVQRMRLVVPQSYLPLTMR